MIYHCAIQYNISKVSENICYFMNMASIAIDFDRKFIVVYITGTMLHHKHTSIFAFEHYNIIVEISKTDEGNVI